MNNSRLILAGIIGIPAYIVVGYGTHWWVAVALLMVLWANNLERAA